MGRLTTLIGLLSMSIAVLIYTWPTVVKEMGPLFEALMTLNADIIAALAKFFSSALGV